MACACSVWAGAVREQGEEEKKRRRKKGEGKKKRGKRKGEKGKRGKGEKEKVTPAGFAASVASQAWRRREATRMRNEETGKVLNDD